jgi:hypothetical protein
MESSRSSPRPRGPVGFQHPVQIEDMVQRGERPVAVRPRHVGYPSPFRGQVCGTQGSLPCFPSMGLSSRRPPFLQWVPASPVPRLQRYYEGATTSRTRAPGALWFRSQAPSAPSDVRARRGAPGVAEDHHRAWGLWSAGLPVSGISQMGTHGISQVSWQSVPRLCPVPRPRPDRQDLASCGPIDAAPGPNTPKAPAGHDIGATPGLQRPLPTLHERRCRRPCKARFRLAGCAFAGRGSNPLDCDERFQVTSILLPRTFLTQAGPMPGAPVRRVRAHQIADRRGRPAADPGALRHRG